MIVIYYPDPSLMTMISKVKILCSRKIIFLLIFIFSPKYLLVVSYYKVQLGINSVVDYYNRASRAVYACAMDLSKAFDLVSWEVLFSKLLKRGVSPQALRCLMFILESDKEQFLPLYYSVYTLAKLSSYYAVQQLDAKSRVSICTSGYMQMLLFCFLLAEQVFRKW